MKVIARKGTEVLKTVADQEICHTSTKKPVIVFGMMKQAAVFANDFKDSEAHVFAICNDDFVREFKKISITLKQCIVSCMRNTILALTSGSHQARLHCLRRCTVRKVHASPDGRKS